MSWRIAVQWLPPRDRPVTNLPRYFFIHVSDRWAVEHDNGCLVSIGLTVPEDLGADTIKSLIAKGKATEITREEWDHSGCQSWCVRRGAKECRW